VSARGHERLGRQAPFALLLAALVAFAWAVLSAWSLSPWAGYLDHRVLEHVPLRLTPRYLGLLGLFVAGWVLMSAAMMLPTSLPLVRLFARTTAGRRDRGGLVALLIIGYLAVWGVVGLLAHLGDLAVHETVHRLTWLGRHEWAVGATTLAVAGVVQLTPLRNACLTRCRSPLSFLAERWGRGAPRRDAIALGVRHGTFCVGCCWPLMAVMFAFACGSLGWMLVLGAAMGLEKNAPWGRRLTAPIAVLLLAGAAVTVGLGTTGHLG
jgi:predicted metal-binding membrane protein